MTDALVSLLRRESCKPLLVALRKRIERGGSATGTLRLTNLTDGEQAAICGLTGQTAREGRLVIKLDALEQLVCDTGRFRSLLELVEQAVGHTIENKAAAKRQRSAQWKELWDWADGRIAESIQRPTWLDDLRHTGWLRARSGGNCQVARKLLADAFELLGKLPAEGMSLPVFAAQNLGDAHALDPDRDLGRLVCRALASMQGFPSPTKKSDWRRSWERAGIVPDELSVTVLSLNLPAIGRSLTDGVLRSHAEAGEPCRLTFRQLRVHPPTIAPPVASVSQQCKLHVCENPSVIASAAERLGANCRPLICVEGQPNLAAAKLLRAVMSTGWQLAYHGDFDWGGIRIANWLYREFNFAPWRFDAASYKNASGKRRSLRGAKAEAAWDRELSIVMTTDGHALEEEQILEELLSDLDRRAQEI